MCGSGGALQHMHPRARNPAGGSLGGVNRGLCVTDAAGEGQVVERVA
jgi:hypothetical protein